MKYSYDYYFVLLMFLIKYYMLSNTKSENFFIDFWIIPATNFSLC